MDDLKAKIKTTSARACLAILVFLLNGCAGKFTAERTDIKIGAVPPGFNLVDNRPPEDKDTEWMSSFVTSCNYGIRRLGDEVTVPPRLDMLRADLVDALGRLLANQTITISRYAIYLNASGRMQDTARGGLGPVVGAVVAEGCTRDEVSGGWYDKSEVTTDNFPLVIELQGKADNIVFNVRVVHSSPVSLTGLFGPPEQAEQLFQAMHEAHTSLADQMRAHYSTRH